MEDILATPFPFLICASVFLGSLGGILIGLDRTWFWLYLTSWVFFVLSLLGAFFFATQLDKNAHNTAVDTATEQVMTRLEEQYQFDISDDLATALIGDMSPKELTDGYGKALVHSGPPVETVINEKVYTIQLVWLGDEWKLIDTTNTPTHAMKELNLVAD